MTLQISTDNSIIIDSKDTGLKLVQMQTGTLVYRPEIRSIGQKYEVIMMPHIRYSAAHDAPSSGAAGRRRLEINILKLLSI